MGKEIKIIVAGILIVLVLVVGVSVLVSSKEKSSSAPLSSAEISGITVNPGFYDLGQVPIRGGEVLREYEIKNTSDKSISLKKIVTSCMCTKAKISIDGKDSKFFGMEMQGDLNPQINFQIPPSGTAKITAKFDPAAHGPQGTGPFERTVFLYFDAGMKELNFKGTVIN